MNSYAKLPHTDFYQIDDLLGSEIVLIRHSVAELLAAEARPHIDQWAEQGVFPHHLVPQLGKLGVFGPTLPERYGGSGLCYLAYGTMMQELERCDSALRSTASVQGSLVIYPIYKFGSDGQKSKYLHRLASGKWLGCFGLTEPNHGSDPGSMETHIQDFGDYYLLNGSKLWISNAPYADIAVVWAKDEQGIIHGLIVERGMEGFSTPKIEGKWSLRASSTGELVFQDVKVPKENVLPGRTGLAAPLLCLTSARYGISWGAIGAAMDCYETAKQYALERQQFGKPIAATQLIQKKLSEMLSEITKAQLLSWRLGVLMNENKATAAQVSLAKRNNVEMALQVARESRQILGAMGITQQYSIMRHMMNLESVITYEGTHDIHLLILGKEITGISAF